MGLQETLVGMQRTIARLEKQVERLQKATERSGDTAIHMGRAERINLVAGVFTPTARSNFRVAAEVGTVDEVTSITATHAGHLILLAPAHGPHAITVRHGNNIDLINGDCVLDAPNKFLGLLYSEGTTRWIEVFRSQQ